MKNQTYILVGFGILAVSGAAYYFIKKKGDTLSKGDTGEDVKNLQKEINKVSKKPILKEDGVFGEKTKTALVNITGKPSVKLVKELPSTIQSSNKGMPVLVKSPTNPINKIVEPARISPPVRFSPPARVSPPASKAKPPIPVRIRPPMRVSPPVSRSIPVVTAKPTPVRINPPKRTPVRVSPPVSIFPVASKPTLTRTISKSIATN